MSDASKHVQPNGKPFITLEVDGQQVRPREATWVVFDPQGEPIAGFPSDSTMKDQVDKAARTHWYGDTAAIYALNEGHRIQLMTTARFYREYASKIKSED